MSERSRSLSPTNGTEEMDKKVRSRSNSPEAKTVYTKTRKLPKIAIPRLINPRKKTKVDYEKALLKFAVKVGKSVQKMGPGVVDRDDPQITYLNFKRRKAFGDYGKLEQVHICEVFYEGDTRIGFLVLYFDMDCRVKLTWDELSDGKICAGEA